MDKNSEAYKMLKILIDLFSAKIGQKESLSVSEDKQYDFQDDLKYTDFYFNGGFLLRDLVLGKIKNCKNETNEDFSQELFNNIMNEVYNKIKKRGISIEKTLNNYLIEEDYDFAAERLEESLRKSKKNFKVILVSDLIELNDIDSCQIGNVVIKKINKEYVTSLPNNIEGVKGESLLGSLGPKSFNRESFLEKHKEHVGLEIGVQGYHFNDELSPVFDSAIKEIRLVFAYLFLCRNFSTEVEKKFEFKIETKEIKRDGFLSRSIMTGLQEYYLFDSDYSDFLKKFDSRWREIILSNKIFVLSNETLDKLKKQCYLDQFNKLSESSDIGEIKNKICRSLDWFLKATLEENGTDEVISLFISLETLLSTSQDPLTSHTDDMAENIAIMLTDDPDERYKYKRAFKDKVYPLRNKIMHNGQTLSWDRDYLNLKELRIYIVWSTLGVLNRIEKIVKYGNGSKAMREYFEREKLKPGIVFPPQKKENKT